MIAREEYIVVTDNPRVLDLFSGAGGFSLGFEMAGFDTVGGIDIDPKAVETYRHNFGANKALLADVRQIREPRRLLKGQFGVKDIDVMVAGLPCQTFSTVGRIKLASIGRDPLQDPRTHLYKDFLRFLEDILPNVFVVENVPGILSVKVQDGKTVPEIIIERAEELGYVTEYAVLNAAEYGVPQTRKRLILIGTRTSERIVWPEKTSKTVTVWDAISDLPRVGVGHKKQKIKYVPATNELTEYQRTMRHGAGRIIYNHITRTHRPDDIEIFRMLPEGGKYTDIPAHLRRYRADKFRDKYRKLRKDAPSWTVEAHIAKDTYRHIYPSTPYSKTEPHRTISVREAARLQSFPDRFIFPVAMTHAFRLIGNAVPPLLAKAVGGSVLRVLK